MIEFSVNALLAVINEDSFHSINYCLSVCLSQTLPRPLTGLGREREGKGKAEERKGGRDGQRKGRGREERGREGRG